MVLRLIGKKRSANIVIKDNAIRYIDIRSASPLMIRQKGERTLSEGVIREGKIIDKESLTMILEECIEEWKIKGYDVRFIVPDQYIVIRKIEVPKDLDEEEIRGYLYLELGTSIHLPFEDPVFDIYDLEEISDNDKKYILLFAAPEQIVRDYTEVFEDAKLHAIVADISPLSIYRLYAHLDLANPRDHIMVVQFDLQTVNVSLFHNHQPVFMRHLTMDLNFSLWKSNNEGILVWTGDPDDLTAQLEDLFTEMDRMMNFYRFSLQQGKAEVTRILLTGDHPSYERIYKRLAEMHDIPVDSTLHDQLVDANGEKLVRDFHLALGLALKGVK